MDLDARITSISRQALGAACLLAAVPASAAGDLQARIDAFVGPGVVPTLDPRTVRDCSAAPTVDLYGSLHRSVAVTCGGTPGWRIFVPVRGATATVQQSASVLAPVVVKRGDAVQISAGGSGFRITSAGSAEQDGRVGAHIRVRLANGTVTNAVVESAGNVSLPGYNFQTASR